MKRFRIRSLRVRIALLCVGVSAALALGLSALGYSMAARGLRESTQATLHAEWLVTANLADGWARERLANLHAVASLGRLRFLLETAAARAPEDQAAADVAVGDAASMAEEIDSIAVIDVRGKVVTSSSAADDSAGLSKKDEFSQVLSGHTLVSGVRLSLISRHPSIVVAVPVLGSNATPIGMTRATLALGPLEGFVTAARDRAGPGAHGTLVDQDGMIIASTVAPGLAGKPLSSALPDLAKAVQAAGRDLVHFNLRGVDELAIVERLPETRWLYVASLPTAEAERAARQFLRKAALSAAAGLIAAIFLSLLVAGRIVRSLVRLTEASTRIVAGDLRTPIEASTEDEVGVLARSFARMVEALREVLTTLKGSSAALSAASGNLTVVTEEQSDFISRQAASLHETQVTAQEIKQTSAIAADRARSVLAVAARADDLGQAGETAVERSVGGLEEIGAQATEVAGASTSSPTARGRSPRSR